MKKQFELYRDGFVANYLVCEPKTEPFVAPYTLKDQLRFEKEMRDIYYVAPEGHPAYGKIGETSVIGTPWKYYASNKNIYVDFSKFYFTLTRVTFLARTTLVSDAKKTVKARVWSYAAFDMWMGEKHIVTEKTPVYQPINYRDVTLEVEAGENDVYFCVQNFGVRDTRNMIALQILDTEGISVTLDVEEKMLSALSAAEDWFYDIHREESSLVSGYKRDFDVTVTKGGNSYVVSPTEKITVDGEFSIKLCANVCGQTFGRTVEIYENARPVFQKRKKADYMLENAEDVLEKANYYSCTSEELYAREGHGAASITYSYYIVNGMVADERICSDILEALKIVNQRCDCSDFILSAVLRIAKTCKLPDNIFAAVREAALNFRYWMDENGADAMCFWSENHALTFYTCQLLAGELFSDETFMRSERTGREQVEVANRRIREWFDVIEAEGFEEFCASGYMGVTLAALVTVYDFAGEEFKSRAEAMIDRIFRESATQCFDGIQFAPMGRVYRGALCPYSSSVQAILYILSDNNAYDVAPRSSVITSGEYKLTGNYDSLMFGEVDTVFESGSAEIHTKKNKNYILTSVASPRDSLPESTLDETTEYYRTKIMNEGFHGTSLFEPGKGGYQQHLWYAAISNKFFTFVTLPGTERDFCGMRPGYWFGNLIFPAIKQIGRELWCHYDIPESVPTKFTHAYFPAYNADECREEGGFRFAKDGDSYMALWCSVPTEVWEHDAVLGGDVRAYGDRMAWYVKVGSASEDGSFDEFIKGCLESGVSYAKAVSVLKI